MILRALYDYYNKISDILPAPGTELKEIGFLIVINLKGEFIRFEDRRIDNAHKFLVKKSVGRTSSPIANYLYDNSQYVLGYSDKGDMEKMKQYFDCFKNKVNEICDLAPDDQSLNALKLFYDKTPEKILESMKQDQLWDKITKNLSKKFSVFSFIIEGEDEILASKKNIINLMKDTDSSIRNLCLITGKKNSEAVEITTSTMIPGSKATAKLVSFQVNSGYDSYGKQKGYNAPISKDAEFAYTTALNHLLRSDSHNKFLIGNRTYVFWASSKSKAAQASEESIFALFGRSEENDDPNGRIELVRETFNSIYSGKVLADKDDKFYILGLAPNSARIAVVYWAEIPLKDFAKTINKHFDDMDVVDTRKEKKPYAGLHSILGAVTLGGNSSDVTPNLPEAVIKSIFQGLPYPISLYQAALIRIRAESGDKDKNPINITRSAIIKAYLNRKTNNNEKIEKMLDKGNKNQGYLCGRLFATLEKIQEDANHIHSIRERYMNAASSTPSAVFATLLNLSVHHCEKLSQGKQIFYEKLKQEIIGNITDFPSHLDLQDQGRFFIGYYQQRQDFFTSKEIEEEN